MNIHDRTIQALNTRQAFYEQGESDTLSYTINYAPLLQAATISTSTWSVPGMTVANESDTDTTATARLSGTAGTYIATNTITTSAGDSIQREIKIHVIGSRTTPDYE